MTSNNSCLQLLCFVWNLVLLFVITGTSNWSGDYFVDTCGVSINVNQTGSSKGDSTIQNQLKQIFERDWSSSYSKDNINDFNV